MSPSPSRSRLLIPACCLLVGIGLGVVASTWRHGTPEPPVSRSAANAPATRATTEDGRDALGDAGVTTTTAASSAPPMPVAVERAGAARTVRARLGGTVTSAQSGAPVEHAYVGLFWPALEGDSPASTFGQWRGARDVFSTSRQLVTWCATDERGAFLFADLEPGTYVLRAELGPLVVATTAPQTLEPAETRAGLRIELRPFGSVAGTLRVPPHVTFDGLRIGLARIDETEIPFMHVDGQIDTTLVRPLADDGSFALGPALPGRHRVVLQRSNPRPNSRSTEIVLGEVEVRPGEITARDFDLVDGFPGTLIVTVSYPRLDPAWRRHLSSGWSRLYALPIATRLETGSASDTIRRGRAELGPLAAGTWTLVYMGPEGLSRWESPQTVRVGAGETVEWPLALPYVAGEVRCVDARTGAALANVILNVSTGTGSDELVVNQSTDEAGRWRAALLPGTYRVCVEDVAVDGDGRGLPETVEWGEDGPRGTTLRLLVPDSLVR